MIALNGDAFFLAGIKAISLLVRNIDRVFVTHHCKIFIFNFFLVGGIIEFIGSLFVTAGITTYSYYLFTESKYEIKDVLSSPVGPMIVNKIIY